MISSLAGDGVGFNRFKECRDRIVERIRLSQDIFNCLTVGAFASPVKTSRPTVGLGLHQQHSYFIAVVDTGTYISFLFARCRYLSILLLTKKVWPNPTRYENQEYCLQLTFTLRVLISPGPFAGSPEQAANLLRVQANSASYPQQDGK